MSWNETMEKALAQEAKTTHLAKTPAYSTALGALILEVYYRYLPIDQLSDQSSEAAHD